MVMKENKKEPDERSLEKLKDRENALVTEICNQEVAHKSTLSSKKKLFDQLKNEKEKILELIKSSASNEQDYKSLETIFSLYEQLQYATNLKQMAEKTDERFVLASSNQKLYNSKYELLTNESGIYYFNKGEWLCSKIMNMSLADTQQPRQ